MDRHTPVALLGTPLHGVTWHGKQAPVLVDCTPDTVVIKYGDRKFARVPSRRQFLARWSQLLEMGLILPLYELIPHTSFARFHLDIEGVYSDNSPPIIKEWLNEILTMVTASLEKYHQQKHAAFSQYAITNGCRPSKGKFKRSFHVVWYNVYFTDNHTAMRNFIHNYMWPDIGGDKCTTMGIDKAIYTRNRAFRLPYSCKNIGEDGNGLLPWDVDTWSTLRFTNNEEKNIYLERCLVAHNDVSSSAVSMATSLNTPKNTDTKNTKRKHRIQADRDSHVVTSKRVCIGIGASDPEAYGLLQKIMPRLSDARAHDREQWMRIGWIISQECGHSDAGRQLFHEFSMRASNYDAKAVNKIYDSSDGTRRLRINTIYKYLKDDDPAYFTSMNRSVVNARFRTYLGMQYM